MDPTQYADIIATINYIASVMFGLGCALITAVTWKG